MVALLQMETVYGSLETEAFLNWGLLLKEENSPGEQIILRVDPKERVLSLNKYPFTR